MYCRSKKKKALSVNFKALKLQAKVLHVLVMKYLTKKAARLVSLQVVHSHRPQNVQSVLQWLILTSTNLKKSSSSKSVTKTLMLNSLKHHSTITNCNRYKKAILQLSENCFSFFLDLIFPVHLLIHFYRLRSLVLCRSQNVQSFLQL